jgi:hypothetical protein
MFALRVLGVLCLAAGVGAAATLMTETFDGDWSPESPPTGWRIVYVTRAGTNDWHREPAGATPWTHHPTPFAAIYHGTNPDSTADSLVPPVLDCTGFGNVTLACSTFFMRFSTGWYVAELRYSVDGGASFPFLLKDYHAGSSSAPVLETFRMDSADNRAEVCLAWVFDGRLYHISYWFTDDVSISADSLNAVAEPVRPVPGSAGAGSLVRDGTLLWTLPGSVLFDAMGRNVTRPVGPGVYYLRQRGRVRRVVVTGG